MKLKTLALIIVIVSVTFCICFLLAKNPRVQQAFAILGVLIALFACLKSYFKKSPVSEPCSQPLQKRKGNRAILFLIFSIVVVAVAAGFMLSRYLRPAPQTAPQAQIKEVETRPEAQPKSEQPGKILAHRPKVPAPTPPRDTPSKLKVQSGAEQPVANLVPRAGGNPPTVDTSQTSPKLDKRAKPETELTGEKPPAERATSPVDSDSPPPVPIAAATLAPEQRRLEGPSGPILSAEKIQNMEKDFTPRYQAVERICKAGKTEDQIRWLASYGDTNTFSLFDIASASARVGEARQSIGNLTADPSARKCSELLDEIDKFYRIVAELSKRSHEARGQPGELEAGAKLSCPAKEQGKAAQNAIISLTQTCRSETSDIH
jgi:hypothetical protein